jgi:hypothetical protein
MNTLNIVVEGQLDAVLLRKYLPKIDGLTPRFFAGNGAASLPTVARNLLVHEEGAVLLVMDADSFNVEQAEQKRAMVLATLRQVAAEERFDVFIFRPEHEVIFFEAPEVLERYWSGEDKLSIASLERGLYTPHQELAEILRASNQNPKSWFESLTSEDGEILRQGVQARQLVAIFESLARESLVEI